MSNYFETDAAPKVAFEFNYFRIPRERWELMLTRLVQMGGRLVTLIVPWNFHEINQGTADFNGTSNTRRNLMAVLKLCTLLNQHCILKIGPYAGSGIIGQGIPGWLANAGHLDTTLQAGVENWFKLLSKSTLSYQWPNGPIVTLQVDGQPVDTERMVYSSQLTEVKWRIWLRKQYESIDAMNTAYETEYRSVNDVDFPYTWAEESTPLERDTKDFLEKVYQDTLVGYGEQLTDLGWTVPIYPSAFDLPSDLPQIEVHSLAAVEPPPIPDDDSTLLSLREPIQTDPDPADIGLYPVWAEEAPIRADGSVRRKFWQVRHTLWQARLPKSNLDADVLSATVEGGLFISPSRDADLDVSSSAKAKTTLYRLQLDGQLLADETLKVSRKKVRGTFFLADVNGQNDLVWVPKDDSQPLTGFPLMYLGALLRAQQHALSHCVTLAEGMSRMLSLPGDSDDEIEAETEIPARTSSYILQEARRGLSEADAALRKAMASIGGLEEGFAHILDKEETPAPQPVADPIPIRPQAFSGTPRQFLLELGEAMAAIASELRGPAAAAQQTFEQADGFTLAQYQQNNEAIVTSARAIRAQLMDIIAGLRADLVAERLPLVLWRVHDQIVVLSESLRWGVLRG